MNRPTFDDRDRAILTLRVAALDLRPGPRVGDYVDFAEGITRRISHIWDVPPEADIQTSDGGSFYLGEGYCSFSGGLYRSVPASTLTQAEEVREGTVWFFHHNWAMADNGVYVQVPFRVYHCGVTAPRS